jgi:hypothetical protein
MDMHVALHYALGLVLEEYFPFLARFLLYHILKRFSLIKLTTKIGNK